MTDLLEKVLDVHGGLDNWRRVNTVDFRLTFRGAALAIKQQPHGLRDVLVTQPADTDHAFSFAWSPRHLRGTAV